MHQQVKFINKSVPGVGSYNLELSIDEKINMSKIRIKKITDISERNFQGNIQ